MWNALHTNDAKQQQRNPPWTSTVTHLKNQFKSKNYNYHEKIEFLKELQVFTSAEVFTYKKPADMWSGMETLIDLGESLLVYVDGALMKDRPLYFNLILDVLQRREFDVQAFAHDVDLIPQCNPKTLIQFEKFRDFLYRTQVYVNHWLNKTAGFYASLLSFCSHVTVISYLINGEVASKILHCVWPDACEQNADRDYPELAALIRNTMTEEANAAAQKEEANEHSQGAPFSRSADVFCIMKWAMADMRPTPAFIEMRDKSTSGENWLRHFAPKSDFYERFVQQLGDYVNYLTFNDPNWNLVPGYYQLIYPMLIEIYNEAPRLNKRSLRLVRALLPNMRLLKLFLELILRKTNLYDVQTTAHSIKLMTDWIVYVKVIHKIAHLPDFLDYNVLIESVRLLLSSDHYTILTSTLHFLYRTLHLFPRPQREAIIALLLTSFFSLFLHWNDDVRMLFSFILVFKIQLVEVQSSFHTTSTMLIEDTQNFILVKRKIEKIKMQISKADIQRHYFPPALQVYANRALFEFEKCQSQYVQWRSGDINAEDGSVLYPSFVTHAVPDAG
eukprot:TRINITY_DN5804_c0_g1_i1.p1 TRINITY_DN5804_c0_g1~~TRINITY_DN5804_c0_g1_i1.p1  ORF type:complete len:558 (+),score=250.48 TRINITY_DN5804_c0_g1_i1:231-1904(+)